MRCINRAPVHIAERAQCAYMPRPSRAARFLECLHPHGRPHSNLIAHRDVCGHYTRLAGLTSRDMCGHVSMCGHVWTMWTLHRVQGVILGCCEASGVRRRAMSKTLPGCARCRPSATHAQGIGGEQDFRAPAPLRKALANKTLGRLRLFARLWLPTLMLLLLPRLGLCSTVNSPSPVVLRAHNR